MKTPTPKTDAASSRSNDWCEAAERLSECSRDLERQNTELRSAVSKFLALLDHEEESNNGIPFHPIHISCCRVMMERQIEQVIERMQEAVK